jgi:hypothetical protein
LPKLPGNLDLATRRISFACSTTKLAFLHLLFEKTNCLKKSYFFLVFCCRVKLMAASFALKIKYKSHETVSFIFMLNFYCYDKC